MSEDKNTTESDVCEACGTIVELGSVIEAGDDVLVLPFEGADKAGVNKLAQKYVDAAKARFATVEVSLEETTTEQDFACKVSPQVQNFGSIVSKTICRYRIFEMLRHQSYISSYIRSLVYTCFSLHPTTVFIPADIS